MFFHRRNRAFNAGRHLGGGGALYSHLNDSSHASSPLSQGGPQGSQNNANNAQNLTPQEQLLAGEDLGLDPENDPIIATTDWGLDIKFGAATLSSGALSGYTYFTMGSYNDTPINWVIIGRSSKGFLSSLIHSIHYHLLIQENLLTHWFNRTFENNTPAGLSLYNDSILRDLVVGGEIIRLSSFEATGDLVDKELDTGEVLVISEHVLCSTEFGNTNAYEGSTLQDVIDELFLNGLGFTDLQKSLIVPQELINYAYSTSYTFDASLFPLAYRGENFDIATYLSDTSQRVAYSFTDPTSPTIWWLRSGIAKYNNTSYGVSKTGANQSWFNGAISTDTSCGVRPAMVIKI